MIEHAPESETPFEDLSKRFRDPNTLGSLSEKEFNRVANAVLKPEDREKWRLRWQHLHATYQTPEQHKEQQKAVHADIMSWNDFREAFQTLIPADQWDAISERFGQSSISESPYAPAEDPAALQEGAPIGLQLMEHGQPLEGTFLKALGEDAEGIPSFQVSLRRNNEMLTVTGDMILVKREAQEPNETVEEVIEILTPRTTNEQLPTISTGMFKLGDQITVTVELSDGTIKTITGTIMATGVHQEIPKAVIYSIDLPDAEQRIAVVDQTALQFSRGEEIAKQIAAESGFSPKEFVRIKGLSQVYRVVGLKKEKSTVRVELIPEGLFEFPEAQKWLQRVEALQRGGKPISSHEFDDLQKNIRAYFDANMVTETADNIERLQKKK